MLINNLSLCSRLLVLLTILSSRSIFAESPFGVIPSNTIVCLGDIATFTCSTTIQSGHLFWFVNEKPINALPLHYQALSTSKDGKDSMLQMLGQEETNNSEIICAIDTSNKISNFSDPVFLIVIDLPSPPTDLTIITYTSGVTPTANITWRSEIESGEILLYTVHVINSLTSTRIRMINTSETHVQYNLRVDDCLSLQFLAFMVSTIHSVSGVSCASEESETKGIPNVSLAVQDCQAMHVYTDNVNCPYQSHVECAKKLSWAAMSKIHVLMILFAVTVIESALSNNIDRSPTTVTVYLHDFAEFICTVGQGRPRLFWFVNNVTVAGLPENYQAMSTTEELSNGMGVNSTLQILALTATNNSLIFCAVDTSGWIDLQYFPSPASLLVQGLPLPPTNLSEILSLELLAIVFTWQPPLGLVIGDGLTYVISINVSIQNLTNQYEVVTSNLSYTHVFMEQENYLELCMYSHLTDIIISLSSKNKVGVGREMYKEIFLCADSVYTWPRTSESVSESAITEVRINTTQDCADELNNSSATISWECHDSESKFLFYATAITTGLFLVAAFTVVVIIILCLCWRKHKKDRSKYECGNPKLPQIMEPNEAYACIIKQNEAYERTLISVQPRVQQPPEKVIVLEPNEAYESIGNNPIIYEEIST